MVAFISNQFRAKGKLKIFFAHLDQLNELNWPKSKQKGQKKNSAAIHFESIGRSGRIVKFGSLFKYLVLGLTMAEQTTVELH